MSKKINARELPAQSDDPLINDLRSRDGWRPAWIEFSRVVRDRKCKTGAEIGVAFAGHTSHLLATCPDIELLYGIDQYHSYHENHRLEYFETWYKYILRKMSRFGDRYKHIRKWSVDGTDDVPDNSLDFIFIDANHNYEYVAEDIKVWTPKVKLGGIIGGHDYTPFVFPGVVRAVDEQDYKQLYTPGGEVWWTIKEGKT